MSNEPTPGSPWDELRAWGVPEGLLDLAMFPSQLTVNGLPLPPQITLPSNWDGTAPSWRLVRDGLRRGMGVRIPHDVSIDLRQLGEAARSLSSFEVWGDLDTFTNVEVLAQMECVRWMRLVGSKQDVDLSHLPQVESVRVEGPSLLSVSRAPRLQRLTLARRPSDARTRAMGALVLSSTVEDLVLDEVDVDRDC